jgi:hypothetical protein
LRNRSFSAPTSWCLEGSGIRALSPARATVHRSTTGFAHRSISAGPKRIQRIQDRDTLASDLSTFASVGRSRDIKPSGNRCVFGGIRPVAVSAEGYRDRMLRKLLVASIAVTTVVIGASGLASAMGKPKITSVTFTGNTSAPVITVHGQGLGTKPSPNPTYAPPGHPLCPTTPPTGNLGRYGLDYGTSLYLHDSGQSPPWTAGRYLPGQGELDCIGLIVTRFTPTTVAFRLGGAYPRYLGAPTSYHLVAGDSFYVVVNGARFSGRVLFR